MKKENIIKKNFDISKTISKRNVFKNKYFNIYIGENDYKKYRFAICVSTKLGNAVRRNRLKRQVKDIIDKSNLIFKSSTDYVIILKKEINELNYEQIKINLITLISKTLD